jgi:catechol 2,3-dioxygenase-like lactoylglutathione lyase family enzyme
MLKKLLLMIALLGVASVRANAPSGAIVPGAPQFVALSVPDGEVSKRWYSEAFGLRVLDEFKLANGDHIIILTSETLLLEILQLGAAKSPGTEAVKDPHLTHGLFKIGFHVADLDGAVAKLKDMKAEFETGIVDDAKHDLRFALLRDPHGNYVQLFGKPKVPKATRSSS